MAGTIVKVITDSTGNNKEKTVKVIVRSGMISREIWMRTDTKNKDLHLGYRKRPG